MKFPRLSAEESARLPRVFRRRLTAGRRILIPLIGVRVPAPEPEARRPKAAAGFLIPSEVTSRHHGGPSGLARWRRVPAPELKGPLGRVVHSHTLIAVA